MHSSLALLIRKTWPNTKPVTQQIKKISAIASDYDVIVFDQWGVLHNGTTPYPDAIQAIEQLDTTAAVLSNSGKRSEPNAQRIQSMGFDASNFDYVMTSGEALWRDVEQGIIPATKFFPIERSTGDAKTWAGDLDIDLVSDAHQADAILLMGLPDGAELSQWEPALADWLNRGLPIYCSNPDRQSPRSDGLVISPGALAFRYEELGGVTKFYGKPHRPVFQALENVFGAGRYLMVGDSMEHDIAGAQTAGWDSLLIQSGLYADRFSTQNGDDVVQAIANEKGCALPTYRIEGLR